ncbi:phage/plasmid primase, P4 family [Bosea sp. (in: a-proteobacteria)]|uniref:DNA primase family protein n=1 Tax=Bosea sp. (in: a-proteobacteria) TaxID=1871050 RepID=UPI0027325F14|nr:DNA primase family protein [Bosea sp. (in: a-proteobacteria)]MDP3407251.1 phage/plasmid primase, P4 family [Bosea sp. (in: a-proteobacteria)]
MTASDDTPSDDPILGAVQAAAPVSSAPPPDRADDGDSEGHDDGEAERPQLGAEEWALIKQCVAQGTHDIGNSRRFRFRCGTAVIHIQNVGWHVYDGRRWIEDIDGVHITPLVHRTVEAIALEAHLIEPTEREAASIEAGDAAQAMKDSVNWAEAGEADKAQLPELNRLIAAGSRARKAVINRKAQRRRFANSACNTGKIDGMLKQSIGFLSKPLAEFDVDPLALNLENGTLRIVVAETEDEESDPDDPRFIREVSIEMAEHRRDDWICKLAPVAHDPEATCPVFDAFLARILPEPSIRDYMLRYLGYALTALTMEQVFVLLHGEGRNGKSTLVDIVSRIAGDYATSLPIATLTGEDRRKGAEATPDLVRTPGARLVRAAEPKEGMAFDESLIKSLTSGEPILVRRLNHEFNEVYPKFKLLISANRKPVIKGNDDGIWRRVVLIPFEVQIPKDEIDKKLPDKLWAERAGILNRLLAGLVDFLQRGALDPPAAIQAASQEYRDESDQMGAFVREALIVTREPHDTETAGALVDAMTAWCRKAGLTPFKPNTITRRLPKTAHDFGFEKAKSSTSIYVGVRIRDEFKASDEDGRWPSRTHRDD